MDIEQIHVPSSEVHDAVEDVVRFGFRPMTMFAEEGGVVDIVLRKNDHVERISYDVKDHAIPLLDITWNLSLYERLMSEMSGITFDDHVPGPIVYRRKGNGHPLQKEPYDRSSEVRIPIPRNRTDGEDIFEIPVGPVHAGIIEPGHFRFSVAGETVLELNPSLGYVHRGIEKLMETPASIDNSRLVERISGDTCVANCIAYSEMMESEVEIPKRAKYIRTILAEMERLYNHVGCVTGMCTDTAFNVPSFAGGGIQEKLFRMNFGLTRHRMLMNSVVPGGVRRDISDHKLKELDDFMMILKFEIEELESMMDNPYLADRLEGTGTLSLKDAETIGALGPIARASGISSDVRKESPYEMYGEVGLRINTAHNGDVQSRTLVRMEEISDSISIVHQCIQSMEHGETRVRPRTSDGFHCSVVEAPRGELVHCMVVRDGHIWRYNVRDPSFINWFGMCHAVPGNVVPDFPLINKSFGLSYSGNDL